MRAGRSKSAASARGLVNVRTSAPRPASALAGFVLPSAYMTSKDLLRLLRRLGCVEVRQDGSHKRVRCGKCSTTVPVHAGEDLGRGLLRSIERDLEPCLGKGWLT